MTKLVFTYQELSTVLAGLRLVQQKLESVSEIMELAEMPHFADVECPSIETIDALCERITCDCEMTGEVPYLAGRNPAPESALRKPHLQAIRELHKVAHDAWFGDETLAAAEKDSGNHGPDEIAAIEANLATVKEAIEIMEKEGLGFIS